MGRERKRGGRNTRTDESQTPSAMSAGNQNLEDQIAPQGDVASRTDALANTNKDYMRSEGGIPAKERGF